MYLQPDMICISYEGIAGYVVHMAVGIDQTDRFQAEAVYGFDQFSPLCCIAAARVYHYTF